jgi:protein transport protein SEC61 subunit gamma and related proteins
MENQQTNQHTNTQSSQQSTQSQSSSHGNIKRKIQEYKRVWKITKKPDSKEFWGVVKITGLGILVVGLIGFIVLSIKIILKGLFV